MWQYVVFYFLHIRTRLNYLWVCKWNDSCSHTRHLFLPLKREVNKVGKLCMFPLSPSQGYPFTFQCIMWYLSVCLSPLITGNEDSGVFVIPQWVAFFFSSSSFLPAKLSTRLMFDVCKNEAQRILINWLKATELLRGKFSLFWWFVD